jgi:hypothetical protein
MTTCSKCRSTIADGEERRLQGKLLCDDCYIDCIWPKVRKAHYENESAEFMRRLQESYSVHPQRYH